MARFKRSFLIVAVPALGGALYLAMQNAVIRNLVWIIGYDRVLDRYEQIDKTNTDVSETTDYYGRKATLVSAFFGLDNELPYLSGLVLCKGSGGKDGMPVVFSHELNPGSVEPGDFRITTSSGVLGTITCLTMAPADDPGELRTVLLVGEFGSGQNQPVNLEIVGNILSNDESLNFKGAEVAVTALEDGPSIVFAERVRPEEWNLGASGTRLPWGGGTGCPIGTSQIVRVGWNGGITKRGGAHVNDEIRELYKVKIERHDLTKVQITPFSLADLSDGDNFHSLCLDTINPAVSVSFPAGHLTDPRDDVNPATKIAVHRKTGKATTQ
ncbi:hypothetical protein JM93_04375 [Roseibium hamelinense]|uniref:Uncharacterized protein n=1 Tax=Roseibium hamelinense TaxID=150831 RepID=A0A562SBZ0_9HYPH|nr:hypothetical protein [Roseibium hamelinense]MTI42158.1 hypothetical protein [Roseibium hamelinense]TWI78718.1 hypothetical protein JM93_04375 [Roseibium hamelinense]